LCVLAFVTVSIYHFLYIISLCYAHCFLCCVATCTPGTWAFSCLILQLESGRVQLKCDGTRWRTGREVKGKQESG